MELMDKRNRIIVLVDFSKNTENLLDFAFNLAKLNKAKVIFVHQVTGMVPALADEDSRNEILRVEIAEARLNLHDLAKGRIKEDAFHVSPKPLLSILRDLSNINYFDWVLAGLKETRSLKHLLIGSTTLKIIDESSLLTLAVPVHKKITVPHKLHVGVTAKFSLNKIHLDNVLRSLKEHIEQLEFFTIIKDDEDEVEPREYLLEVQKEYEAYNPQIQLYKGKVALELLKDRMKKTENSFLVLQQGSRSLTDKLFRSFMINELVYEAHTPLIVLSS